MDQAAGRCSSNRRRESIIEMSEQQNEQPTEAENVQQQQQPRPRRGGVIPGSIQDVAPLGDQDMPYVRMELRNKGWSEEAISAYIMSLNRNRERQDRDRLGVAGVPKPPNNLAASGPSFLAPMTATADAMRSMGQAVHAWPAEMRIPGSGGMGGGGGSSPMESIMAVVMMNMLQQQNNRPPQVIEPPRKSDIEEKMENLAFQTLSASMVGGGANNKQIEEMQKKIDALLDERQRKAFDDKLEAMKAWFAGELEKLRASNPALAGTGQPGDPSGVIDNLMTTLQKQWEATNKFRAMMGLPPLDPAKAMGVGGGVYAGQDTAPDPLKLKEQLEAYGAKVDLPPRSWEDVQKHMQAEREKDRKEIEEAAANKYKLNEQKKETLKMAFEMGGSFMENLFGLVMQGKGGETAEKLRNAMTGIRKTGDEIANMVGGGGNGSPAAAGGPAAAIMTRGGIPIGRQQPEQQQQ